MYALRESARISEILEKITFCRVILQKSKNLLKAAVPPFMLGEVFFTSTIPVFFSAKVKKTFASNKSGTAAF